MDRTKEFRTIVRATGIPQEEFKAIGFFEEVHALQEKIQSLLSDISHLTSYESFRIQPLLTKGYELVKRLKNTSIPNSAPGVTDDVLDSLRSITGGVSMRALLRLNEASRRCVSHVTALDDRKRLEIAGQNNGEGGQKITPGQVAVQESVLSTEHSEEVIQGRRRIVKSISEIGQLVEDISIHVSLQDEQLRRIDDSMKRSEKWSKKALNELRETWEIAGENRGQIFKFFGVWLSIFIIFWLVKR
ncbi:hypothetical protein PAEPH01_0973 [Pancytospora epiphaga]|nr:hypothetical protein PAEPH01_0973 [Pancytospora epiphaga]